LRVCVKDGIEDEVLEDEVDVSLFELRVKLRVLFEDGDEDQVDSLR
jgi:predicted nucleotidyltransferase